MSLPLELSKAFREHSRNCFFWVHLAPLGLAFVSLWPVAEWTVQSTNGQSRLFHAILVLCLAFATLVRFGDLEIKHPLQLNPAAQNALIATYLLLAIQWILRSLAMEAMLPEVSLIAISAYCCAIAAAIRFTLGSGTAGITMTACGTFCGFIILSQLMEPLDWPLRQVAGTWSAAGLDLIGKQVELGLANGESGPPKLILAVNGHPFHVASECNGFGVILSGILIGLLLALHQKLNVFDTLLNLLVGFILGFAFNVLRIIVIILLAPALMDYYMVMHEIVGGITYWSSIVLVWILLKSPTRSPSIQAA